jgi:hypothetical protein
MQGKDLDANVGVGTSARRAQPTADPDGGDNRLGRDISAALRIAGSIAAPTTLVVALLFYFGWARTQALLDYFGINAAIAHLSVNDYVLRSLGITVRLLVILGLLTLILLSVHRWLVTVLATRQHSFRARFAMLAFVVPGLLLCVAGILGFYNWVVYSPRYPFVPILFAVGVTLVGYGFHIRSFEYDLPPRNWSARAQTATLVVVNIAFIFWTVAVYASIIGREAADQLASKLGAQPSVIVYSTKPLGLTAPGIKVEQLPGSDSQYRYRYSSLRLLLYSNGRYFLLPNGWRPHHEPVILLEEGSNVRFEFYTGS